MLPRRTLMAPGPSDVYPQVLAAMGLEFYVELCLEGMKAALA